MTGLEGSANAMMTLRQHMLMFLPIASAMSDRLDVPERTGALNVRVRTLLRDAAARLRSDITEQAHAQRLRDEAEALEPELGQKSSWNDLILANLLTRLRDFIDLRQDVRLLQQYLNYGQALRTPFAFSYTARAQSVRHRDPGMALLSSTGAFIAITVTCAIWIATGWPDGSAAPMMAAVACSFFATFDDPAPYIVSFANSAIIGAICAALYLFAVLPLATNFEMLTLARVAHHLRLVHDATKDRAAGHGGGGKRREYDCNTKWHWRLHAVRQLGGRRHNRHVVGRLNRQTDALGGGSLECSSPAPDQPRELGILRDTWGVQPRSRACRAYARPRWPYSASSYGPSPG